MFLKMFIFFRCRKIRDGHHRQLLRRPPPALRQTLRHRDPQSLHHVRHPHPRLPHGDPGVLRRGRRRHRRRLHRLSLLQRCRHRRLSFQRARHRPQLLGDDLRHGQHALLVRGLALHQDRRHPDQRAADVRAVAVRLLDLGGHVRGRSSRLPPPGERRAAEVELGRRGGGERRGQRNAAAQERREGSSGVIGFLYDFVNIVIDFFNKIICTQFDRFDLLPNGAQSFFQDSTTIGVATRPGNFPPSDNGCGNLFFINFVRSLTQRLTAF